MYFSGKKPHSFITEIFFLCHSFCYILTLERSLHYIFRSTNDNWRHRFYPSCSQKSPQLQKQSWSTPLCVPQTNFYYMCFINPVDWTGHVSQCESGVCNLSMPYAFSVSVDDRYFYELADKPFTVVYFQLNEWYLVNSYDQYCGSLTSEELFYVDTKEMLMR